MTSRSPIRLAIVVSHPIQYYAPWFRHLAQEPDLEVRVFHLWDFGVTPQVDPGFGHAIQWDIPLLEGYASEFVPNVSADPGTHHFGGLDNPELVPRLLAWKPDAILLFGYAYRSHLRVILSRRLKKIPLLFRGDSHDLARPKGLRTWAGRLVRRILFRRFAAFLSVGKAHADYLRNSGVPEAKIVFCPHAVDNARFQSGEAVRRDAAAFRASLGIPAEARVVLFAGKFEAKKRPLDLLEAFHSALPRLAPDAPPPTLLLVGAGSLEADLRRLAASLPPGRVAFAPFQNQSRMPVVYAAADLLALPSVGPSETWGLAVNEAMAAGRPALVSDHVGCARDLVQPGETGWVVPAGNTEALARALEEVLGMPAEGLRRLGAAARARVQQSSYTAATAALRATLEACGTARPPGGSPG